MAQGYTPEQLVTMILAELRALSVSKQGQDLVGRYLERREIVGSCSPDELAFLSPEGRHLQAEGFEIYVKGLRRVGVNAEFNGALCRGLLSARFDMTTPLPERLKTNAPKPAAVGRTNENKNREENQCQRGCCMMKLREKPWAAGLQNWRGPSLQRWGRRA